MRLIIKSLLNKIISFCVNLDMNIDIRKYDELSLKDICRTLKTELTILEDIEENRMSTMEKLLIEEQNICLKLGCEPLGTIAPNVVPTEEYLRRFKIYLQKQKNKKIYLENIFIDTRLSIIQIMNDLNMSPSSRFEKIICNNYVEFVMSSENMTKLKQWKNDLETHKNYEVSHL